MSPAAAPTRLSGSSLLVALATVLVAVVLGVAVGPVAINPFRSALELLDALPLVDVDSGLSATDSVIVSELRLPRVVLGLLVGGLLSMSGATFQGAFRNPLVDPYLLGVAAGAGFGATIAIVAGAGDAVGALDVVPLAAFGGAVVAMVATLVLGSGGGRFGSPAALVLAGVAVTAFFTALQTYVQQRDSESLRQVYTWILGRLATSGWGEVAILLPYAAIAIAVMFAFRGHLDVLAVGDEEAASLGMRPSRVRTIVAVAASMAAAAAVAVSGLIGFVGLIVPHGVRLLFGVSNRVVVPLSLLFGGAFLVLTDLLARTVESPAELPIGVVTAFFGAPFFLFILTSRARMVT